MEKISFVRLIKATFNFIKTLVVVTYRFVHVVIEQFVDDFADISKEDGV